MVWFLSNEEAAARYAGLGGRAVDVTVLSKRSKDWVGVINGGPGDDYLRGTEARDRIDGSSGDDVILGLGGHDRLYGGKSGTSGDYDRLYGGQGNDDVLGGPGENDLYAWTRDPAPNGAGAILDLNLVGNMVAAEPDSNGMVTITARGPLPQNGPLPADPRLSHDAWFFVSVGTAPAVEIKITAASTTDFTARQDLVTAIQTQLNAKGLGQVTVGLTEFGRLTFTATANRLSIVAPFGVYVVDATTHWFAADSGDRNADGVLDAGLPDPSGQGTAYPLENTGLNRMLGAKDRPDYLFGGTNLDFMYGRGGGDKLFRRDGTLFTQADGALLGDEWKDYAKDTDNVWYVSATNVDDQISVNYVTEPGLLKNHHLVTRLTENSGYYTFDAQVRLDFSATDQDGNPVWDAKDIVLAVDKLRSNDPAVRENAYEELILTGNYLPPEGDFSAIIIDALGGDDTVTVGPTVQKSVWVDGGPGDDHIEYLSGSPILSDLTDQTVRNDDAEDAYPLESSAGTGLIEQATTFKNLTLDGPDDVDWFAFTLPPGADRIEATSLSQADGLEVTVYTPSLTKLGTWVPATLKEDRTETADASHTVTIGDGQQAWRLDGVAGLGRIVGLNIHAVTDQDWFVLPLQSATRDGDTLSLVNTAEAQNQLRIALVTADGTELRTATTHAGGNGRVATIDMSQLAAGDHYLRITSIQGLGAYELRPNLTDGVTATLDLHGTEKGGRTSLAGLTPGNKYLVKVSSNHVPTLYDLAFYVGSGDPAQNLVNLGVRSVFDELSDFWRMDVILGGTGNDVLCGGPGEDWIIGGPGNDVLTGGQDGQLSDLLFGEEGDDTFQVIPNELSKLTGTQESAILTLTDEFDGGPGEDRVLFLGGDRDMYDRPVPDHVAIKYDVIKHQYVLTSLVWDTANQEFLGEPARITGIADAPSDGTVPQFSFQLSLLPGQPLDQAPTVTVPTGPAADLRSRMQTAVNASLGSGHVVVDVTPNGRLRLSTVQLGLDVVLRLRIGAQDAGTVGPAGERRCARQARAAVCVLHGHRCGTDSHRRPGGQRRSARGSRVPVAQHHGDVGHRVRRG